MCKKFILDFKKCNFLFLLLRPIRILFMNDWILGYVGRGCPLLYPRNLFVNLTIYYMKKKVMAKVLFFPFVFFFDLSKLILNKKKIVPNKDIEI